MHARMKFLLLCLVTFGIEAMCVEQVHASDTLFEWMQGCWEGAGQRASRVSDRVSILKAHTQARVQDSGRLDSHNELIDETAGKSYVRDYWVRASGEGYELGNAGSDVVGSRGQLDLVRRQFHSTQDLGGGWRIESRTEFDPEAGRAHYIENGYRDSTELYETHIQYYRLKDEDCRE